MDKILAMQAKDKSKNLSSARELEKNKDSNRFLYIGSIIMYALLALYLIFGLKDIDLTSKALLGGAIALALAVNTLCVVKFSETVNAMNVMVAIYTVIYCLIIIVTKKTSIQFSILAPLLVATLYYNRKMVVIFGSIAVLANILLIIGGLSLNMLVDVEAEIVKLAFMMCSVYATYATTRIGRRHHLKWVNDVEEHQKLNEGILNDILQIATDVKGKTDESKEIVEHLAEASQQLNYSVDEITAATVATAESIQDQTEMTQTIQEAIVTTVDNTSRMVDIANVSETHLQDNAQIMQELKKHSSEIAETNVEVAHSMDQLQIKTKQVKDITNIILNISAQTNLLALNASIESARAGDAGRGFAVVAEQIRELADQSKTATESISAIIKELEEHAGVATTTVQNSIRKTSLQGELINKAVDTNQVLNENMHSLQTEVREVGNMTQGLQKSNNQIVDSINQLSAASEEVTAGSSEAAQMAENNKIDALNTRDILQQIAESVGKFDKYMQ